MPAQVEKYCKVCSKKLILNNKRDIERKKFCSRKCLGIWMNNEGKFKHSKQSKETIEKIRNTIRNQYINGRKSIGWKKYKPTKRISGRGYYFLGHKREHQVLIELKIGRKIKKDEVVHHKDLDNLNNNIDNLKLMKRTEHSKLHAEMRRKELCLQLQ